MDNTAPTTPTPFPMRPEHMLSYIDFDRSGRVALLDGMFAITTCPTFRFDTGQPYQSDFMVALLCLRGTASGRIDGTPYRIEAGQFCIILPRKRMEGNYLSTDFEGWYIVMSDEFLQRLNIANSFPLHRQVEGSPLMMVSDEKLDLICNYCNLCSSIIGTGKAENRLDALLMVTRAMFLSLADVFHTAPPPTATARKDEVAQQFLSLAERDYAHHRDIAHYADRLCITPKYLGTAVGEVTGMTPGAWIERFVVHHAQQQLTDTRRPVAAIADELHFPTPSLFGRYFKRLTGLTPLQYRAAHRAG